jgi:hypothetical protein
MRRLARATLLLLAACFAYAAFAQQPVYDFWPNPVSHTNSDAWLREHHAQIARVMPRVLLLIADNRAGMPTVNDFVAKAIAGVADGSRYHGYKDKSSQPQLLYRIALTVDLRDQASTPWPSSWPVTINPDGTLRFRYDALFTKKFALLIGYPDPKDPARMLTLRELFEQGIINEVWMVYPESNLPGTGSPGVFETAAHVQMYDEKENPIPGKFDNCWGIGCDNHYEPAEAKVTMRFAELNIERGVGCFIHATGHAWEGDLERDIPSFEKMSARFFNRSLKEQGLPIDNLYDDCPDSGYGKDGHCWEYPTDHTLTSAKLTSKLAPFKDDQWGSGCGSVHFPPNGRFHYDYDNTRPVLNTCENFGLHNGPGGKDLRTLYRGPDSTILAYERAYGDCGGGWNIFLRQNFPGFGSHAKNDDGSAMKSWWPYFYY